MPVTITSRRDGEASTDGESGRPGDRRRGAEGPRRTGDPRGGPVECGPRPMSRCARPPKPATVQPMADKSDLPMLAVKRPLLVGVLNLLIVIAGLAARCRHRSSRTAQRRPPDRLGHRLAPGAAPETMDSEVTSVLEDAVARVTGVRQINSSSEENNSRIRVEFNPGVDLDTAASDVREAVSRVTRDLPDRVEQVNIIKADADAQPIMILAVSSDRYGEAADAGRRERHRARTADRRRGRQHRTVRHPCLADARVGRPARLNRFGLTMSDVATALEGAPLTCRSDRSVRNRRNWWSARMPARSIPRRSERSSSRAPLGSAMSRRTLAPANATNFVRLDGRPIVGLGVVRRRARTRSRFPAPFARMSIGSRHVRRSRYQRRLGRCRLHRGLGPRSADHAGLYHPRGGRHHAGVLPRMATRPSCPAPPSRSR